MEVLALSVPATQLQPLPARDLPWIQTVPSGAPYFVTENGQPWTPIGQNDAVNWPDFDGLYNRRNLPQVEGHLRWLKAHGITVLRLMMEYSQTDNRYLEKPAGRFVPRMVQFWDDLFALCSQYGIRILLTPADTFWMWRRWKNHPYNKLNGGPCAKRTEWLVCPHTLQHIKNRLTFAVERWGGSGVLFAWDLWNEIQPTHGCGRPEVMQQFITELSTHVRELEQRLYGRTHPQTVSIFGPQLYQYPEMADAVFKHPLLDFASTHFYDNATINSPKDTIGSAICAGHLTREALEHITDNRPFFDSEHGPIHYFKDRGITLKEDFDDEYFRHIQWAHLASGGAGGGMRWPYRTPHVLTHGMRRDQQSLARFTALIDWANFHRKNINHELISDNPAFARFGCADGKQAVLYLLKQNKLKGRKKMIDRTAKSEGATIGVPGMEPGSYRISIWNTQTGDVLKTTEMPHPETGILYFALPPIIADAAVAIRQIAQLEQAGLKQQ